MCKNIVAALSNYCCKGRVIEERVMCSGVLASVDLFVCCCAREAESACACSLPY